MRHLVNLQFRATTEATPNGVIVYHISYPRCGMDIWSRQEENLSEAH
jgi:hypothetical protein